MLVLLRCSVSVSSMPCTAYMRKLYTLRYATAMPCFHNICLLNRAYYAPTWTDRAIDRSKLLHHIPLFQSKSNHRHFPSDNLTHLQTFFCGKMS
uniref:Putative secreted protein n=1 Tax=Anopheles marajoara TaxID=58244 RepID=A0A2M4C9H0_9DIPT